MTAPPAPAAAAPPPRATRPGSAKARKTSAGGDAPIASNIIIELLDDAGVALGPHLDVPSTVTPAQLAALVNGVKGATGADALPYAFSVGGAPLATALGAHLAAAAASVEGAVAVVARPQASFRVRPVSRCAASMPGHSDAVLVAAFSPCGGRLATGSGDATVRLWDLSLHTPAATLTGHAGWVLALAWAPDGSLLASGGADAVVHLWAPARGGPGAAAAGALRGHTKHVTSLAWEPLHAAAAGAGPRLVTGSKDGTARVWCPATRRSLAVLASHRLAVTAVAWGGNNRIYTASRDATINVWDAAAFTLVTTLSGHGHWVNALALSTDAALRTGATDHTGVAPADPGEARAVARKRYDDALRGRPETLASASDDFTVFLWRPSESSAPAARLHGHAAPVSHLAFSPDGAMLATASFDKSARVWDGVSGAFRAKLLGHVGAVYRLAWAPDSRLLATASKDSTLKVWDAAGGGTKAVAELPGHADEVYALDWAPAPGRGGAGGGVASGSKDRLVRIWKH